MLKHIKKTPTWMALPAGLLLVAALLLYGGKSVIAGKPKAEAAAAHPKTEAPVFQVEEKRLTDTIDGLIGTVKGDTLELTFNGQEERLATIHVEVGQFVRKGDTLFELDHTRAKARMVQAQSAYERTKELHEAGGATGRDLDEAKAAFDLAKRDYEDTYIYAPKSGHMSQIDKHVGETVARSESMGVLVSSEDDLFMETGVIESQLDRVARGQEARIHVDAIGPDEIKGVVQGVAREVTLTGRTGNVLVRLPSSLQRRLRPGLSARCTLVTFDRDALVIPRQAYDAEKKGVFLLGDDGKAHWQPVQIGYVTRDFYEVLEGLKPSDQIIADLVAHPVNDGMDIAMAGEPQRFTGADKKL